MEQVTILIAFAAGLLSFFSPCIFPLVPAYVSHLTGSSIENNKVIMEKNIILTRSIAFILGFSIIFVIMGASASLIGQFFNDYRLLVEKISGLLIIVFGLQMAGILNLRFFMYEKRWESKNRKKGVIGSSLLGMAFASGWTPCVGLALSSILLLAGSSQTVYSGMLLLFIYSIGLGIPFLFISVAITYSLRIVRKINRWLPVFSKINGTIMITLGILLYTGQMQKISAWLARFTLFNY